MQNTSAFKSSDPYQWFFPAGFLFGILGTSLWIVFGINVIPYPGIVHSEIMTNGFMVTVALGFLMTAIPRMTATYSATVTEKIILSLILLGLMGSSFLFFTRIPFYIFSILQILFVFAFAGRRIVHSNAAPPPSFIMVAMGLVGALAANVIFLIHSSHTLSLFPNALARLLLNYGLFLGLVLGAGSQLVPAFTGLKKTAMTNIQNSKTGLPRNFDLRQTLIFGFLSLGIFFSLGLEAWGHIFSRFLRALIVSAILVFQWRIYLFPKIRGIFGWCLWLSAWMLFLGIWSVVLWPSYATHTAHIMFVGCVSLLIFTIATRVTLAHGGHDKSPEVKSVYLTLMLVFFMLALFSRISAPFVKNPFNHLAYASGLWIGASLCWSAGFLGKIFLRKIK